MKTVYLDYAATSPTLPEVLKTMLPYFSKQYGNPSEPHALGQQSRLGVENSRQTIADFLNTKKEEIIFTSCATESINLAHKGLIEGIRRKVSFKPHIITTSIEHKAVINTCRHLEEQGLADVTCLPVDKYGLISVADIEKTVKPETVLVSVMYVNNEVGTIQPIPQIGQLLQKINQLRTTNHQPITYFHTDATQAIQYLDCDVKKLGADLLSFTGHKFGAPKGIGVLYVKSHTPLIRQIDGGSQERDLRSGTENVPFIVGLGKAITIVDKSKIIEVINLRNYLTRGVLKIPGTKLTGHPLKRAPHIASFIIEGVEGEALVLLLSNHHIAASSGSACTSRSLSPSHVLTALGIPPQHSHGSLRVSLNTITTKNEVDYFLTVLPRIVDKLRKMAPEI